MVEGGAVPIERNLLWDNCRFKLYDYKNKAGEIVATTVAAVIKYIDDDKGEYEQAYSVGDPARFQIVNDGKNLKGPPINRSCNYYHLMTNLLSAGFPDNKLSNDISALDGLYTYNIGMAEPKRAGLEKAPSADGTAARVKMLSIPSKVLRLPWEKKGAKASAAAKTSKAPVAEDTGDVVAAAIDFVKEAIPEGESMARQDLAVKVFKDLAGKPNQNAIASIIFKAEFSGALIANGFGIDGEVITRA
jgi:hypothetical protein